jgi:energy-coupling factor transporter ATP-binding protein EcfA2
VHWTRPGKDPREGESAILHPGGPFVVFSTDASMTGLHHAGHVNRDGSVSVSPFDFYVAHRHGGDASAAGRTLRAMMDPAAPPPASRLSTAPPAATIAARKVRLTATSAIGLRRVHWTWEGRIANGTLALLAGPEGLGKSTLAYWMAAQVTLGLLPGEDVGTPRSVLVCATEDSWEHTIAPRLHAHGADLDRVFRMEVEVDGAVRAELSLPADLLDVEEAAAETDASLLILDPLMSRLDAKLDSHRDAEVRLALEPLVSSCVRSRLACLGLIHHNKSGSTNPLDLVMASKAFTAVARAVHHVVRDPDDDTGNVRLFGMSKNNLGRMDLPTLSFTIASWTYDTFDEHGAFDGRGEVGQLQWGPDSLTTITAALRSAGMAGSTDSTDWLRQYMRQHGPRVNSSDALKAADAAGIPRRTVQHARTKLGLDSEDMPGFGPRRTYWFDPTDSRLTADDSPDPNPAPNKGDIT